MILKAEYDEYLKAQQDFVKVKDDFVSKLEKAISKEVEEINKRHETQLNGFRIGTDPLRVIFTKISEDRKDHEEYATDFEELRSKYPVTAVYFSLI